jgi:hypothetical protein
MKLKQYDVKETDSSTVAFFGIEGTEEEFARLLMYVVSNGKAQTNVEPVAPSKPAEAPVASAVSAPPPPVSVEAAPVPVAAEKPRRTRKTAETAPTAEAPAPETHPAAPVVEPTTPSAAAPVSSVPAVSVAVPSVPTTAPKTEVSQPEAQAEPKSNVVPIKPASAKSNGDIPKEAIDAKNHRDVVAYLFNERKFTRAEMMDWCNKHQSAVPALARIDPSELAERLERTAIIIGMA